MVLALENLQEVFVMLVVISFLYLHFVAVLHLSMFFIHIFFSTSSLTVPWTIARFLHSFCTFSPAHPRVIRDTFIFNHFVIFLPLALRFWVGIFYPQAFFTLPYFSTFLAQPAFYKDFPGSWKLFLEICRASHWSSKNRPGPSFCLIDSNPQSSMHLKFVFIHVNITKFLLVVKTLIKYIDQQPNYSAAMKIHQNIKRQPQ